MRVYISGPMTGKKDFNYPEFHRVAQEWRELGHDVFCPAENFKGSTDYPWEFYMKEDLRLVMHCDAIVMLDGWSRSRGAIVEAITAKTCGLQMFDERGRDYKNINLGSLGYLLKVVHDEYSNQREDEEREDNTNGRTYTWTTPGLRPSEFGWTIEEGRSDAWVAGEE